MDSQNQIQIIDNSLFTNYIHSPNQEKKNVLIVLNFDILPFQFFNMLSIADIVFTGDGGANKYYDMFQKHTKEQIQEMLVNKQANLKQFPDYIIGDFDSARKEILDHFKGQGSEVFHSPCQDSTDLEKVLKYFSLNILKTDFDNPKFDNKENKMYRFFVLGSIGGRIDHTITNLSLAQRLTLHFQTVLGRMNFQLQLVDQYSLITCITPGQSQYLKSTYELHDGVGVFPLQKTDPALRTEGLKWDIDEYYSKEMEFGKFLSSSNEFVKNEVKFICQLPFLFTTTLQQK